ncbi:MAG: DUF1573 domain-containing protein [Planctomycetales bacterium]|nr:DUF1573 domain-containing protein [Planctomycetales bacterium]
MYARGFALLLATAGTVAIVVSTRPAASSQANSNRASAATDLTPATTLPARSAPAHTGSLPAHPSTALIAKTTLRSAKESPTAPQISQPKPQATTGKREFHAGLLEPNQRVSHRFEIQNTGQADLVLTGGDATCQCVAVEYPHDPIPPGKVGVVEVSWSVGTETEFYQQAVVKTNDPYRSEIRFDLRANVASSVGFFPPTLEFGDLDVSIPGQYRAYVYSQLWDQFHIGEMSSSWEGLTWTISDVPSDEIASRTSARAAKLIEFQLPPAECIDEGYFRHWVRCSAQPGPGEDAEVSATSAEMFAAPTEDNEGLNTDDDTEMSYPTTELLLGGKVLRRLCVYGKGVQSDGTIELGHLVEGQGAELSFLLKVRDTDRRLRLTGVRTDSQYVSVEVEQRPESESIGLYTLRVTVPKNAPLCDRMATRALPIVLEFDHPRIKQMELLLSFAVVNTYRRHR